MAARKLAGEMVAEVVAAVPYRNCEKKTKYQFDVNICISY